MPADRSRAAWRRILPVALVAAATLLALAAISEGAAHLLFRASASTTLTCLKLTDRRTGVLGLPGSDCAQKIFESGMVRYHFDDCGFRTPQPCAAAPVGTYRIVLLGSSIPYGMHVNQPDSFAAKLGPLLARRAGRPIDVFNEAMQWGMPASIALRPDAMLKPHPDMIVWALTPFDINNVRLVLPFIPGVQETLYAPAARSPAPTAAAPAAEPRSIPKRAWDRLIRELTPTRTVFAAQHYLYRSQSQYIGHTLSQGEAIDYLRVPAPPALRDNLATFAAAFGTIAARAKAAGVPLVVTLLPSRPQAIMLANRSWEKGYDPAQLGRLLRPIVEAQGARYVDMTAGIAAIPDAGQLYFSVDEHLPPAGHTMLAGLLADALVQSGALPAGGAAGRVAR